MKEKQTLGQAIELFNKKSEYLLGPESYYDFQEIYLHDFVKYIFDRDQNTDPFEETLSPEYRRWQEDERKLAEKKRRWKEEHPEQPFEGKIDYSGYPYFRYNPIAIEFSRKKRKDGSTVKYHTIVTKDNWECLDRIDGHDFVIMSPITYVGRNRYANNARYLYAFAVDLDGVGMHQIRDVIWHMRTVKDDGTDMVQLSPVANIIVNSGHGLHLYYILRRPIQLFQHNIELLNKFKKALTERVWNQYTSTIKSRQYQGIFQGFRLPGTKTKFGQTIRAFYNNDSKLFTLRELNGFFNDGLSDEEVTDLEKGVYNPNNVTLKEAERRWPEWYDRVIVRGDKVKGQWICHRGLYDWWLRRLQDPTEKVAEGHRYFCMMALAVYAKKCNVAKEELEEDAMSLVDAFDRLTINEDNHFLEDDARDALQAYRADYVTFPRNSIEFLTGLKMPVNKRNGREQKKHLGEARMLRDFRREQDQKEKWDSHNGRKRETYATSENAFIIAYWRYNNRQLSNKSKCAKDLELDRKTVSKWWAVFDSMLKNTHAVADDIYREIIDGTLNEEGFRKWLVRYGEEPEHKIKASQPKAKDESRDIALGKESSETGSAEPQYKYLIKVTVGGKEVMMIDPTKIETTADMDASFVELENWKKSGK